VRVAASLIVIAALLTSCSGDDDDKEPAKKTTTTTVATTSTTVCSPAPTLPAATDGSAAQLVAHAGDVRIAIVDHGASVDVVSLFVPLDCELQPATIDGSPAALPIGGTVTHGDGLGCAKDEFEVRTATSDDGATYELTATTYRLEGTELVQIGTLSHTVHAEDDPEAISVYYRLDC
jgi:hypothetical protein